MADYRTILEEDLRRVRPPDFGLDQLRRVRERRDRNRRIATAAVALGVFVAIIAYFGASIGLRTSQPANPVPFHHNGDILISQEVVKSGASSGQMLMVDAATGDAVGLSVAGLGPTDPAWSPDGSELAYVVGNTLYVLDVSTGESREIVPCKPCDGFGSPAWSPDGSTIAVGGNWQTPLGPDRGAILAPEIDLFDAATSELRNQISIDSGRIGGLAWSSDGRQLEFVSWSRSGDAVQYSMRPDGSEMHELQRLEGHVLAVAWSPDSSAIAYLTAAQWGVRDKGGCREYICPIRAVVLKSDGSGTMTSFPVGSCLCNGYRLGIAWSPDGTQLALSIPGPDPRKTGFGLFVASVDGSGLRLVLAGGAGMPSWRPVP